VIAFKLFVLKQMRRRFLQPLWEAMSHVSKIGQNHWSTSIPTSGEREALRLLSRDIPSGGIVFDVGSNVGQYCAEAAKYLKPRIIHAFEPSNAAFSELKRNTARLGLDDVVKLHRLALGDRSGQAVLHSSSAGASIASLLALRTPHSPFQNDCDEDVLVQTIDEFCDQERIEHIDLLKIDVEGFELNVLKGAWGLITRRDITAIQFEFGPGHIDARTYLRDFFDLFGSEYELYRIVSDGLRQLGSYTPELEVFATANYLAVLKPGARSCASSS
jgi:FkbM family methyltransferase